MDHPIRLADQLRAHLRAMRLQRGLTQAELGRRLGLGQVRIADIEARPGAISVDQLMAMLSALGGMLVVRAPDADADAATVVLEPARRRKPHAAPAPSQPEPIARPTRPKRGSW